NIASLPDLITNHPGLKGLNVTVPYKKAVLPFLDNLDETAQAVGAVNCIKIENGVLTGFNTDVIGFKETLKPLLPAEHPAALILGTGGAAAAVAYALRHLGIKYRLVSRSENPQYLNYTALSKEIIEAHLLIINTTPAGMFPAENTAPEIPY